MESTRYALLHQAFAGALPLSGDERSEYLRRRCGGDEALRRDVERLLAAVEDDSGGDLLSEVQIARARARFGQALEVLDVEAHEGAPERVGAYSILGRLAEGGMGVVYEACQDDPRRRVALKVLHPGQATPKRIQRFRQEARILGRLQHPGIAQIFEAGSFDLGRGEQPYYAMEFVEGVDVCTFAERAGLDARGRLALLAEICDAVHHAHRCGVVHRDLKPDNVLVGADGRPKVLDFGVALATDTDSLVSTLVTEEGQILGTLGYMAPEQLAGDANLITPRTDVYALGVLAWSLLVGGLPVDPAGLSLTAGLRLLTTRDAPRLRSHSPQLGGDVDTIVGKALEKEPDRRYESAEALASDLRRFLRHRPIAARPPSRLYLARKFARRHRGFVAALAALVLGALGTTTFGLYAQHQRRVARDLEVAGRNNLYIAEMQVASSLASEPASVMRVREIVERWRPRPGERDRRGFEWYLLHAMSLPTEEVVPCAEGVLTARWHPTLPRFVTGERPARIYDAEAGAFVAELPTDYRAEDVAWSPSGDAVALTGPPRTRLFEVETGRLLADLQHDDPSAGISWHPSGSHLLLVTGDGAFRRVDRDTGAATLVHVDPEIYGGPGMLAYAPDGERLVVLPEGRTEARILNATSWNVEARLRPAVARSSITCVAWSPDGARVATGNAGGAIGIWRSADWTQERVLEGHEQFVTEVSWSPDGSRFLSACRDSSVRIWDPLHGHTLRLLRGHALIVEYASWSPDGRRIVSASGDGTLRIWDAARRPVAWTEWPTREDWLAVPTGAWSPDGKHFAHTIGASTRVRRFEDGRFTDSTEAAGQRPVWTADGRLVTYTADGVVVSDVTGRREGRRIELERRLEWWTHYAGDPRDPDRLVVADAERTCIARLDGELPEPERPIPDVQDVAIAVTWSPDGDRVLVARMFATHLWSPGTGSVLDGPAFPDVRIQDAAWSPTGDRIAFALEDLTIRILAVDGWRTLVELHGHVNQVHALAWRPDGSRLCSASADGTVRIWEPDAGRLVATLDAGSSLSDVSWSPDGRCLTALGFDGTVHAWDASTGYAEQ